MSSDLRRLNIRGFTLVEIAIVLILVGLVAAFVLPPLVTSIRQGKISEAKSGLTSLKDQVIGYALDHKKLPPDLSALDSPRDPYLRPWRYLANPAISESNILSEEICNASTNPLPAGYYVGSPVLRLLDQANNTVDFVAFVVASDGPDQKADIDLAAANVNSTLPIAGWSKDVDLFNDTDGDGKPDPYDDLVQFVTLLELKALFNCGMSGSSGGGAPTGKEWVQVEEDPTKTPGKIYGYGEDAEQGYGGIEHEGTKLSNGGDGGASTLAARIQANWFTENGYCLEVRATDGSLSKPFGGSDRIYIPETNKDEYLRKHKGEALPFGLSYNMDGARQLSWSVGERSLATVLPPPASGTVRVLGNFWITALVYDNAREVTINITGINNYPLPDPAALQAPVTAEQRNNTYLSQRTEAVDNLYIQGDVAVDWEGDSYPNNQENGLRIVFEIHDMPLP